MQPSDLTAFIAPSCEDVLDAMYFTSVMEISDTPAELVAKDDYAFALRFRGDLRGSFGIRCERATARTLAANFLGEEEDAVDTSETAEVIGELANMLCGSILSRTGCSNVFALSHPEPMAAELPGMTEPSTLHATLRTDIGTIYTWMLFDQADGQTTSRGDE